MISKLILILSLTYFIQCEKSRFDNYSVYKIYPENDNHIKLLQDLQNDVRFDFWSDPVNQSKYVMVLSSPDYKTTLEDVLSKNSIGFDITMPNIQDNIDQESANTYSRYSKNMLWNAYYSLDAIYSWIEDLAAQYPNIVTVINGGTSYEGRPIKGLKISHGPNKRIVFLEGGLHAREWISPATVNYITNDLLTSTNEDTVAAANDFEWHIFPVTNPDGYVWSHENFRMWRKNRRPIDQHFGVDLNRNWDNSWLLHGASTDPATDVYAGSAPFSEPETRDLSNYISSIGDRIDLYLSFHSFGNLLLLPFGNSTEAYANYDDAINIGRRAMGALSVRYGTLYRSGTISEVIMLATGGSIDWVKEHENVPLVYCYELRDGGTYGFLLPPDQILPTGLETMDSILELIHQARRFGYLNSGSTAGVSLGLIVLVAVRGLLLNYV